MNYQVVSKSVEIRNGLNDQLFVIGFQFLVLGLWPATIAFLSKNQQQITNNKESELNYEITTSTEIDTQPIIAQCIRNL